MADPDGLTADAMATGHWLVSAGAPLLQVATNRPELRAGLAHALGAHMTSAPLTGTAPRAASWTLCVIGVADFEVQVSRVGEPAAHSEDGLADYWRSDFVATRLSDGVGRSAVRHIAPFEGLTLFDGRRRRITYLMPMSAPVFLPHVEHLVGYVLRAERWAQGFVDVHAAFLRYRGKGLALIGPKRAGKTSLAMHLVSRGADMLGSDMAQIRGDEDGVQAASVPHLCRITPETVWDNTWLSGAIGRAYDHNHDYLAGPLYAYGKYELYDPMLERVFQRRVDISAMRVDAIVFPQFRVETAQLLAVSIAPEESAQRLVRSFRTDRPLADWLAFDLTARARAERDLERRLATRAAILPGCDLHFGREASLRWGEIDAMVDGL